jgi:hypothetical protein
LANSHQRRKRYSLKVWSIPKVCISTTCASSRVTANTIVLALCTVGPRHGREVTQILARRACLHVGGSR